MARLEWNSQHSQGWYYSNKWLPRLCKEERSIIKLDSGDFFPKYTKFTSKNNFIYANCISMKLFLHQLQSPFPSLIIHKSQQVVGIIQLTKKYHYLWIFTSYKQFGNTYQFDKSWQLSNIKVLWELKAIFLKKYNLSFQYICLKRFYKYNLQDHFHDHEVQIRVHNSFEHFIM